MRRLLIALGLLLLTTPLEAAIARTGSCSASTTGCTLSAVATGDLVLSFAFRSGNVTPPTADASNTSITTVATAATGTVASFRISCRVASSSADTSSGTYTNATAVVAAAYSGTNAATTATCNATGVGNSANSNAKTSATASYPTVTLRSTDTTAWVAGFVGGTAPSTCSPTGLTSVSAIGTVRLSDTNAAVNSWTTATCAVTSETWMTYDVEVVAAVVSCGGCTATYIQGIASGREGQVASTGLNVLLRNATQSGVALVMALEHDMTNTPTVTITDDKGNVWTQNGGASACTTACAAAVTSNGQGHWLFYATNVIVGTQAITVTFNSASTSTSCVCDVVLREYYNVSPHAAFDKFGTFTGTGTAMNSTGIALGNTVGDLVIGWATDTSALTPNTTITPGTGFVSVRNDGRDSTFFEESSTATTVAFSTGATAATWNLVGLALKVSTAGSAPAAGLRIIKGEFFNFDATATVRSMPCTGNLLAINWTSPDVTITSITDSNSNHWVSAASVSSALEGLKNQTLYTDHGSGGASSPISCSSNMTVTLTYSGTSAGLNGMTFYDITGAASFSALDVATTGTNPQTTAGNLVTQSITPSTAGELVINGSAVFWHTITGCSTNSGTCITTSVLNPIANNDPTDGCTNITGTAAADLWEDDAHSHVYNAAATAITFTYTNTSSATCTTNKGVGDWASVSVAFKAPATGGTCQPTLGSLGVSQCGDAVAQR